MDSFTEKILTRARERQMILKNITDDDKNGISSNISDSRKIVMNSSQTDDLPLNTKSPGKNLQSPKIIYEGTLSGIPNTKTLNINEDNLSMEIKLTSSDLITVQVEVEKEANLEHKEIGLRKSAKDRLNRLGKLYGGDETEISSPIHKTEELVVSECSGEKIVGKGLKRLANLAKEMNHWEDDVKPKNKNGEQPKMKPILFESINKKNIVNDTGGANDIDHIKSMAFNKKSEQTQVKSQPEVMNLDKSVLDTLESQGFQRVLKPKIGKLTYDFINTGLDGKDKTFNTENVTKEGLDGKDKNFKIKNVTKEGRKENLSPKKNQFKLLSHCDTKLSVADKAARFESTNLRNASPDPSLLSISEKKALFEKNTNEPLVPKAPFGSSIPNIDTKHIRNIQKSTKKVEPKAVLLTSESTQPLKIISTESNSFKVFLTTTSKGEDQTTGSQYSVKPQEKKYSAQELGNIPEMEEEDNTAITNLSQDCIIPDKKASPIHKNGTKRQSVSPKVAAVLKDVKKVKVSPAKPGQLYPNLSDIETDNEDQTQPPSPNSSLESDSRGDINSSFGREIMDAVCRNQVPQKRASYSETQSDVSDILNDMDDYLNESLSCDEERHSLGPTPPKQSCRKDHTCPSHSFNYKKISPSNSDNFKSPLTFSKENSGKSEVLPHVVDGENTVPLTHTISFYRKQTTNNALTTPTKRVVHEDETCPKEDNSIIILGKIRMLQDEINKQQLIISQTSRALNLCNSTLEFMGSTEQVEAEKLLLLATQRRQAMLNEIQRLKVEGTLRPQNRHAKDLPLEKGSLTISNISLPLKKEYVRALAAAGGKGHHVTCLVKCGEEVVCSKVISTVATDIKNPCYELTIPESLTLNNIYSDFAITFEIYCLQAQEEILPHDVKYHIKKDSKLTPKKSKQNSLLSRPVKESPAGPMSVRSPSFALMGYVVLSIQQMNKKTWKLNNTPTKSPLEGSVDMTVSCELTASVEHRGFLTMFGDISGFGAWHRRWFVLKENSLSYWKYPDDEKKIPPIDSIDLNTCINEEVGPVSREICARMHTFLLETVRERLPQDKDSLITIIKNDRTIIRHLLSADIKEERILWCSKINAALTALKLWGKNRV